MQTFEMLTAYWIKERRGRKFSGSVPYVSYNIPLQKNFPIYFTPYQIYKFGWANIHLDIDN